MWNCLEKVVAIAGGCVAVSAGAADPGTIVGSAVGAAGLLAFWREQRAARGPESDYRLGRIRERLFARIETDPDWCSFDPTLRDSVDFELSRALLDCRLDHRALADAAVSPEGFPKAAAALWLDALALRAPLFSAPGESMDGDPDARRFAGLVIEEALELAWADRVFFANFLPNLMKSMARTAGATHEAVKQMGVAQHRQNEAINDLQGGIRRVEFGLDSIRQELLDAVRSEKGVPIAALEVILATMGDESGKDSPRDVERRLRQKADEYSLLVDRLNRLSNDDPGTSALRKDAAHALAEGDFAACDQSLAAAEARDLAGLEDLEALGRQKRLSAAESREQRAAAAMLKGNAIGYREAADHFGQAALVADTADSDMALQYLTRRGTSLVRLGVEFARDDALEEAVAHYRAILVQLDRDRQPLAWAALQHGLGDALRTLGARRCGCEELGDALAICQWPPIELREDSVLRLTLLANTYRRCTLEQGRGIAGASSLIENIQKSFESLAEEFAPDVREVIGAMVWTENGNKVGLEYLKKAADAYGAALEERSRDRTPEDWRQSRRGLACTLRALGDTDRNDGEVYLQQAFGILDELRHSFDREAEPLDWALTTLHFACTFERVVRRASETPNALPLLQELDRVIIDAEAAEALIAGAHNWAYEHWAYDVLYELEQIKV